MNETDKIWLNRFWTKLMLTLVSTFIVFVFTMAGIVYATRIDVNHLNEAQKENITKTDVIWYVKYRDAQNESVNKQRI